MKNPFKNIDTKGNKVPMQKKVGNSIVKKGAGRPVKPNMGKYLIKMDKVLHNKLLMHANSKGLNKSAVITVAVSEYLSNNLI